MPEFMTVKAGLVDVTTEPAKMTARFCISCEDEDRDGDVVVAKGLDLTHYAHNAPVLLNHRMDALVGTSHDGQRLAVEVMPDRVYATCHFMKGDALSEEVYRKVNAGLLKGASIGFKPLKKSARTTKGGGKGLLIEQAELVEWSITPTPVCRGCLRQELKGAPEMMRKALGDCGCGCEACTKPEGKAVQRGELQLAEVFFAGDRYDKAKAGEYLLSKSFPAMVLTKLDEHGLTFGRSGGVFEDGGQRDEYVGTDGVRLTFRKALPAAEPVAPPAVFTPEQEAAIEEHFRKRMDEVMAKAATMAPVTVRLGPPPAPDVAVPAAPAWTPEQVARMDRIRALGDEVAKLRYRTFGK